MKASVLSLHTPTTPGVGLKGHFCSFLKVVMLDFKVKWKTYMQGNTLNLHTILTSEVGFKCQILKCRCKYIFY